MKGVSDNNAPKNKKSQGNKLELRKPLQVLHINKKDTSIKSKEGSSLEKDVVAAKDKDSEIKQNSNNHNDTFEDNSTKDLKNIHLESSENIDELEKPHKTIFDSDGISFERTVDEFDFDENAFLAALNENEPIGLTGETIKGKIIAVESDGIYIDIGGKAPGFMPKKESGLGVITNFKEKFPIGLQMEVLVIKEQNADGMVTVSARALILRKSWENVSKIAKEGGIIEVLINGFNRGGLTCDVDGLRGFIPRSQLEKGNEYQSLVSKNIKVAFLEVNPESRKLVLSEKKALLVTKFSELSLGQLIKGEVLAVKPYGFFIDIGGASGLLHQSSITKGSIRDLREIFNEGEYVSALITEIDLEKGRIGLNTALLEDTPGELLIEKQKVMNDAEKRALKTKGLFDQESKNNE